MLVHTIVGGRTGVLVHTIVGGGPGVLVDTRRW